MATLLNESDFSQSQQTITSSTTMAWVSELALIERLNSEDWRLRCATELILKSLWSMRPRLIEILERDGIASLELSFKTETTSG